MASISKLFLLFSLAVAIIAAPIPNNTDPVNFNDLTIPSQGGTYPSFIELDSEDIDTETETEISQRSKGVVVTVRSLIAKLRLPGSIPSVDKTKFKRGGLFPGIFGPDMKGSGPHISPWGCHGPCFFEEPNQGAAVPSGGPPAFGPPSGGASPQSGNPPFASATPFTPPNGNH
ncbi:hypothetical protein M422DRAFT_266153 [Sphaerobolus stellatus SS14]|uniref:Uncharacterized protein n=1 Tax=Sphaerobolus stellatus (strain SS14) TaxID=990650 RepID=A0A0C9TPQ1_SPHS4|nr:hypothetical protein M422DRAFT_266153 [Sphaerobolus stellatus SS14]